MVALSTSKGMFLQRQGPKKTWALNKGVKNKGTRAQVVKVHVGVLINI